MAEDRKPARGRAPVTWHPLFPAIAALWFAALFGLGTLAVRTALLEAAAVASGIDRLVPAAAPPLGTNARILIAFALALLGGAIGATIGTLLARSKPSARARRAQAVAAKAARAQSYDAAAPLPVQAGEPDDAPNFIDISLLNLDDSLRIEPGPAAEVDSAVEAPQVARASHRPLDPMSLPLPESFALPGGGAAARLTAATLDSLSHVELIERLAVSLQKRREDADEAAEDTAVEARSAAGARLAAELRAVLPPVPSYYPPAPEPATSRFAPLAAAAPANTGAEDAPDNPVALFRDQLTVPLAALRQESDATERALRDALATLQRMSGAA